MIKKRMMAFAAAAVSFFMMAAAPLTAYADSTPYVALGADLSQEQKEVVLRLLKVTEEDLKNDTVLTVTNEEEHQYLDSYLDPALIGTRALSSCKVCAEASGHGITVEAHNISYLTPSMYVNALATAGMKDASVVVAGPFEISGTAALVGAMKAYAAMSGTSVSEKVLDGATDELMATEEVAADLGDSQKAAELVAAVKEIIVSRNYTSEEDIRQAILEVAAELGVSLTDAMIERLIGLMHKLASLDLDAAAITEQAKGIYEELKSRGLDISKYGVSESDMDGFWSVFAGLLRDFIGWFKGIFG
ncbi:MAG: DUF1002 domain-containing protein [Lachnospiraceae bacterium]|nr:DUF1002 domain-containing protein [Lachnospiraceae bacterium]